MKLFSYTNSLQKLLVLSMFFVIVGPGNAFAATISFSSPSSTVRSGDQLTVSLVLDTKGDTVNAIEGSIRLSPSLKVLRVYDGQSIVPLWNTRPQVSKTSSAISFSGIMPGGYSGDNGLVFSFDLEAQKTGEVVIETKDLLLLRNDGLGSEVSTTSKPLIMKIEPRVGSSTVIQLVDRIPPEVFQPEVTRDENLFGGRYFLIFQTVDKQSGVDRYEVLEIRSGGSPSDITSWTTVESPYELRDQGLTSDIYVRAVDRSGNFIVSKVSARHPQFYSKTSFGWVVATLATLFLLLLLYRKKR